MTADRGLDADVAVIGYGPTGMTAAALLGELGHRVVVLERYPGLYNLPKAGGVDHETMRTWAAVGVAEDLEPLFTVIPSWDLHNAAGQVLAEFALVEQAASGWAEMYLCHQPDFEDALDSACRALPSVDVRQGVRVVGLDQHGSAVRLDALGPDGPCSVTARWVLACDGGESPTRELLGIDQAEFHCSEPHLVCDFALHREVDLPIARQICDPAQPRVMVPWPSALPVRLHAAFTGRVRRRVCARACVASRETPPGTGRRRADPRRRLPLSRSDRPAVAV